MLVLSLVYESLDMMDAGRDWLFEERVAIELTEAESLGPLSWWMTTRYGLSWAMMLRLGSALKV